MEVQLESLRIVVKDYLYKNIIWVFYRYPTPFLEKEDNEIIQKGFLTLHSDNTETGGSTPVPIEQLRHIWRVIRIVDAPAD